MTTTRARTLFLGGLFTAMAFLLSAGDALSAPPGSVTASVKKGRLVVAGTGAGERVSIRLRPGDPSIVEVDVQIDGVPEFSFVRSRFTAISVSLGNGNDTAQVNDTNGVFTDTELTTLDGGSGDDVLLGGHGPETLLGGTGIDSADGNQGVDTVDLGTGADAFQWDPGDGSDIVEGGDGIDRLRFNASNAGEKLDLSADGSRLLVQRDIAAVTLEAGSVELVDFRTFGSADRVNVHDLTGTDVTDVAVDLAATAGGGDAQADSVVVEGTSAADALTLDTAAGATRVTGPGGLEVTVSGGEPSLDVLGVNVLGGDDHVSADPAAGAAIRPIVDGGEGVDTVTTNGTSGHDTFAVTADGTLVAVADAAGRYYDAAAESVVVNSLDGEDTLSAAGNLAALTTLRFDGGTGNDTVLGGNGADVLRGGDGADLVDGNQGVDTVDLGTGDDTSQWDPGDASDIVEGGQGIDRLRFNASNAGENLDLSADGTRLRLTRDIGTVTLDAGSLELVDLRTLASADRVTIHDLTGTDVTDVAVDLAAAAGGGDAQADSVVVEGTSAADGFTVDTAAGGTRVTGPGGAEVTVSGGEPSLDVLGVNALGGDDHVTAAPAAGAAIRTIVDGGEGADTVTTSGTIGDDTFVVTANGSFVAMADAAGSYYDAAAESVVVNGLDGEDMINAVGNLAALTSLSVDGGSGNDTLLGGNGADSLQGGDGADLVDGNQGVDTVDLGTGADAFQWDPGDGSDIVEGGDGIDRLRFNASNAGEKLDLSADGSRLLVQRDIAAVTLEAGSVELVDFRTFGSADRVNVHDLTGTDVTDVAVDLAATAGGGDAQADSVVVEGTSAADALTLDTAAGATRVTGPGGLEVTVSGGEPSLDVLGVNVLGGDDHVSADPAAGAAIRPIVDGGEGVDTVTTNGTSGHDTFAVTADGTLVAVADAAGRYYDAAAESVVVNSLDGEDTLSAAGNLAALTTLRFDGGTGNDTVLGGNGADVLRGGDGADLVDGNQGVDTVDLGTGDDTFQWDPGDASDIVEGGQGIDRLRFNASNAGENLDLSADGTRLRLTRDIGTVTLDAGSLELVDLRTLASADRVTIHDLTGTPVMQVDVDLAGSVDPSQGDGQADQIVVEGTGGVDSLAVSASGGVAKVSGLAAEVVVRHPDYAFDRLDIATLGGDDTVDDQLPAGVIQLYVDGTPQS